ncbi:MAG: OsmC family peroxiredoxin [Planctomycetota bacterium]|nr:MAG: OsmC family peroxiredoxin [Planctomycetota bacterium]
MTTATKMNGLDLGQLQDIVDACTENPDAAQAKFEVATRWTGATRSESKVENWELGGQRLSKDFTIRADEPTELLGGNTAPNPQEYLLSALNACLLVGYVAGSSLKGITLESIEIRSQGQLDLRGFLGLAPVPPGCPEFEYTVRIQGNGSAEDFEEIHQNVQATSPNYFHLTQPIPLRGRLELV